VQQHTNSKLNVHHVPSDYTNSTGAQTEFSVCPASQQQHLSLIAYSYYISPQNSQAVGNSRASALEAL
jgi:hypothetical protein